MSAYWNEYQTIPAKVIDNRSNKYELRRASFQGVKRLFVISYDATDDNKAGIKTNRNYFLPKARIKYFNLLTDGITFYDQLINDLIKEYY